MNKLSFFWQHQVDNLKEVIGDVLHRKRISNWRLKGTQLEWAEHLAIEKGLKDKVGMLEEIKD